MTALLDNFVAADATTLQAHTADTGQAWTRHTSSAANDLVITGNRLSATPLGTNATSVYWNAWNPVNADYDVEAPVVGIAAGAGNQSFAVLGRTLTGALTFYEARYNNNAGSPVVQLVSVVNNSFVPIGSAVAVLAPGVGLAKNLKLEMRGTAIKLHYDGAVAISATDATVTAAGQPGVRANGGSPGDVRLESLTATDAASGTTFTDSMSGAIEVCAAGVVEAFIGPAGTAIKRALLGAG